MDLQKAILLETEIWGWLYCNPGKRIENSPFWGLVANFNISFPICNFYKKNCKRCIMQQKRLCCNAEKRYDYKNKNIPYWGWDKNTDLLYETKEEDKIFLILKIKQYARKILEELLDIEL